MYAVVDVQSGCEFFDDQTRIEPRQPEPAVGDRGIQRAEAEFARAAYHVLREMLFLVPTPGVRGEFTGRELSRSIAIGLLILAEIEIHDYCSLIVMFEPTADDSSNQRAVTVFVSV